MKAISIRQPWAWLIVNGYKPLENRNWITKHRGEVLIHASLGMSWWEYESCHDLVAAINKATGSNMVLPDYHDLNRGGIVGIANLTGVISRSESPWFSGKFAFVMEDARNLPFHKCRGTLSIFNTDYREAA